MKIEARVARYLSLDHNIVGYPDGRLYVSKGPSVTFDIVNMMLYLAAELDATNRRLDDLDAELRRRTD